MKRPIELDYTSYVAYARALEDYCDLLEESTRSTKSTKSTGYVQVAWAVSGCSKMWVGEYAELDAKAEARRILGTCVAYPLYVHTTL